MPEPQVYGAAVASVPEEWLVRRGVGRSYTFKECGTGLNIKNDLRSRGDMVLIRLDHGWFPEGNICDGLVSEFPSDPSLVYNGALIELKGRHWEHAVGQLETSLRRLRENVASGLKIVSCNVVARSFGTTLWQKKKKQFAEKYDIRLAQHRPNSQIGLSSLI